MSTGNTGHASKDIEKANEVSRVGKVSQSFVKEGASSEVLGQEVKPSSDKLDLKTGALVKRNVAESGSSSSCLNDALSSVCSSRKGDNKPGSTDVNSECGSSSNNVSVEASDPMKLWEAMKQNGFLSNPHGGGVSGTSSSCVVSSSHGGIPAPRKRGRKSKYNNDAAVVVKKRKIEVARKEEVDRFARLAAPSGLLNELNPGIINHVRNKKQVLSIIRSIVKSDKDSGNYHHSMRLNNSAVAGASRSDFNQGFKCGMPEDNYSMHYHEEKCADGEENSKFSENASSLSSEDAASLNRDSVLTVKGMFQSVWMVLYYHRWLR